MPRNFRTLLSLGLFTEPMWTTSHEGVGSVVVRWGRGVANERGTTEANISRSETSHVITGEAPVNSR